MYHGLGCLFIKLTRILPAMGTPSLSLGSSVFHTVVYMQVPGGPVAKTLGVIHVGGGGFSIPGQGTRSHMLQLRAGTAK